MFKFVSYSFRLPEMSPFPQTLETIFFKSDFLKLTRKVPDVLWIMEICHPQSKFGILYRFTFTKTFLDEFKCSTYTNHDFFHELLYTVSKDYFFFMLFFSHKTGPRLALWAVGILSALCHCHYMSLYVIIFCHYMEQDQ